MNEQEQEKERSVKLNHHEESKIIPNQEEFHRLLEHLPARVQLKDKVLAYALRRDGASYRTLLNNCKWIKEWILLVQPIRHPNRFVGGFGTGVLQLQPLYFGSAEMFVFRGNNGELDVFRWEGENRFFVHCSGNGIGLGGGSNFALHVDAHLKVCSTGFCETFKSPPLVEEENIFECLDLEVWGFLD
jgi:hypothetical protein